LEFKTFVTFCREKEKEEKEVMNYINSYIDSKLTDCLVELFDYGFEIEHITSKE
jgi:hypothetical protein